MRVKSIIFVTFLVAGPMVHSYKFPEKFERCHRNDPALDNCLKLTIQNAFKLIGSKGIPSLNLPSIDPLEITNMEISAGSKAVNLVQKYSDVQIFGLSNCDIKSVHLDLDNKILKFTIFVPKLEQKAKYEVDGKIMLMSVVGKGDSLISLFDVTMHHILTFEEETKNGKTHFKIKSYQLSINPNGAHYQLDNLFNGDEQLASNVLKVLNDNWKDIFDDVKEVLDSAYSEVYKTLANRLFSYAPVHEIFLN